MVAYILIWRINKLVLRHNLNTDGNHFHCSIVHVAALFIAIRQTQYTDTAVRLVSYCSKTGPKYILKLVKQCLQLAFKER